MESHLIFVRFNFASIIFSQIPEHYPVFVSVIILTNIVEVDNKPLKESHE